MHLKLLLAYDGSSFLGWQETREGPSIQGTLRMCVEQITQAPAKIEGASRTDAGVHAWGQVVSLQCCDRFSTERLVHSLQCLLPESIAIRDWEIVSDAFHPSLQAKEKTYRYLISRIRQPLVRHQVWTLDRSLPDLDLNAMQEAAHALLGHHNFSAFATDHLGYPIRDPYCCLKEMLISTPDAALIEIQLRGNRFLYKMCRTLVGSCVEVGLGRRSITSLVQALQSGRRADVGLCAPAQGLCLMEVLLQDSSAETST